MVSPENTNWLYDYGFEDIPVPDGTFSAPNSGFSWPVQALNGSSNVGVDIDGSLAESDAQKETGSKKRFMELGALLEPGRPPKADKAAILVDAVRMVTQLRGDAQKLKDSNLNLQEKIKELKPGFLPAPPAIPAAFAAQSQAAGNKLVPIISYPGVAMWQFMPPAAVDTSQDHVLRPPVA
ncbi:hypothetical protein DH2020_031306 [Rehmannia glutinosa]|uniref:Uncharacterized protein n=1 Tax=Rehmannia glutinosa TaxID=99300 RepID=A0ABR0VK01_REHGL